MKKTTIAFDIDGTLRSNLTETTPDVNQPMVSLAYILGKYFKNIELHAWSGGGAEYAWQFVRHHGMAKVFPQNRCHSKLQDDFRPDIAIDDMHEFNLGGENLIVRVK